MSALWLLVVPLQRCFELHARTPGMTTHPNFIMKCDVHYLIGMIWILVLVNLTCHRLPYLGMAGLMELSRSCQLYVGDKSALLMVERAWF
jgi:hypothetical protein